MEKDIDRTTPFERKEDKVKSNLHIVLHPNKVLTAKSKPVTNYGPKLQEFAEQLILKMEELNGDGLAAIQVGKPKRMFVVNLKDGPVVFVNPKLVEKEGEIIPSREGCLSIPGIVANLKCRSDEIYVEGKTPMGEEIRMSLDKQEAIIFQHELDHLDGITIFDRMGGVQRRMKKKKYQNWIKKLQRKFKRNRGKRLTTL